MTKQQQSSSAKGKVSKTGEERKPLMEHIKDYFTSLRYEWLKLTFPTKKELTQSTIVVFLFTITMMLIISLYDVLVSFIMNKYLIPTE
jgi:preprotein translocase SecE subunit